MGQSGTLDKMGYSMIACFHTVFFESRKYRRKTYVNRAVSRVTNSIKKDRTTNWKDKFRMKLNKIIGLVVLVVIMTTMPTFGAKIKIHASFGPLTSDPASPGYNAAAIAKLKVDGALSAEARESLIDPRLLMTVTPEDLMAATRAFYRGTFDPTDPSWAVDARGGTVWFWVELIAEGDETVSMADIMAVLMSTDPDNILKKEVVFNAGGVSYSPALVLILEDGSMITSGSPNQQGKRVIVGIGSRYFPVATPADVKGVRDFIGQFLSWGIKIVVSAKGVTQSLTLMTSDPSLVASLVGGRLIVSPLKLDASDSRAIQKAESIGGTTVWASAGVIHGGENKDLGSIAELDQLYVRYAPRPAALARLRIKAPSVSEP